jgi:hypothetical protein
VVGLDFVNFSVKGCDDFGKVFAFPFPVPGEKTKQAFTGKIAGRQPRQRRNVHIRDMNDAVHDYFKRAICVLR